MKIKSHVVSSGIVGSILYIATNSPLNGIVSFLAGVFIDLDHFLDYYLNYGISYKFKTIHETMAQANLSRLYLILHSFELLAIFWLLIFLVPLGGVYFAAAIGLTQHIFLDQISNPIVPRAYFFTYRLSNKFKKESIIKAGAQCSQGEDGIKP